MSTDDPNSELVTAKRATRLAGDMLHAQRRLEQKLIFIEAELGAYRDAAEYDATMEGPRFKGWNRSQLDRARKLTEQARRRDGER